MTKRRGLFGVFIALLLILGVCFESALAGWASFDQAWGDANAQKVITEMAAQGKERGWSAEAISGLLGNANIESGFQPGVTNGIGCSGIVQFCFGRATAMQTAAPDWRTNYKAQIKYIYDEMGDGSFIKLYNSNIAWYAAEVPGSEGCAVADFNAFKGIKDAKCAAIAFAATHERCGNRGNVEAACAIRERASFADQAAKSGKIGSAKADDSNKDDSKKQATTDDSGKPVTEDELTGMPDRNDYKSQKGFTTPNSQLDGLSGYSVATLKDNISLMQEVNARSAMRAGIMLLGIAIWVYGLVLGMAYMFDKANTVFEFSMLEKVTFGRMNLAKDRWDTSKVRVTNQRLFLMILICVLAGSVVLSGAVFDWALELYWFAKDKVSSFTDWHISF